MGLERLFRFLPLLDSTPETRNIERLRGMLRDLPGVRFQPDECEGSEFDLPPHGRIVADAGCPPATRRFFAWWCGAYRTRRTRKRDALTGLFRRSFWERRLKHRRRSSPCSVAMADIDHFKRFNDEFGHGMGDRVLEAVGERLRGTFAGRGALVRYGGEEFLLLVEDGPTRARNRLDRFRSELASRRLFEDQPRPITISIGLARHVPETRSIDRTIGRADRALYQSKRLGRNRLTRYAPYLDRRNRYYTWGIYRYLWGGSVRFCAGSSRRRDEFLLYRAGTLSHYRWDRDEYRLVPCPDGFPHPVRCIRRSPKGYYLLDGDGDLWEWTPGEETRRFPVRCSEDSDPPLVELTGHAGDLRGVGLNNQRYRVGKAALVWAGSLPEHWDRVLSLDSFYVCVQNTLIEWGEDGCADSWPLPEPAAQICSDGEAGLVVGDNGEVYRFDPASRRWEQLTLGRLMDHPVKCREVSAHHGSGRLVIRDRSGRLLMARRTRKSTPQRMNLAPGTDPDTSEGS